MCTRILMFGREIQIHQNGDFRQDREQNKIISYFMDAMEQAYKVTVLETLSTWKGFKDCTVMATLEYIMGRVLCLMKVSAGILNMEELIANLFILEQ